jgi:hypothetical protein
MIDGECRIMTVEEIEDLAMISSAKNNGGVPMNKENQKYERPEGVLSPLKAIRAKCLDCMCGSHNEVRLCPSEKCPLYAYRLGHRPKGGI